MIRSYFKIRTLPPLLFFFLLVFSGYSHSGEQKRPITSKYNLSNEERTWLKEFFRDLLFENTGAYVLYGTKPMSWICIQKPPSEEELKKLREWINSLPDEKKKHYQFVEGYDFFNNYQKWKKIKDQFPIKQYLFGTFPPRFDPKGPETLLFLNIEMTIRTLLKHYDEFKRALGFDFDPIQVTFEVENRESKFWNAILDNDPLLGILLGFGKNNSWFFKWSLKYKKNNDNIGDFFRSLSSHLSISEEIIHSTPQHFNIPAFQIFGLHPSKKRIQQYKKERDHIKKLYRNSDEVDLALKWLTR